MKNQYTGDSDLCHGNQNLGKVQMTYFVRVGAACLLVELPLVGPKVFSLRIMCALLRVLFVLVAQNDDLVEVLLGGRKHTNCVLAGLHQVHACKVAQRSEASLHHESETYSCVGHCLPVMKMKLKCMQKENVLKSCRLTEG